MQQIKCIANKYYTKVDVDDAFRIDAKPFVERPFFLEEVVFTTTSLRYQLLNGNVHVLPGDVIRSNPSLLNAMKIGAYYRADLVINASMAGNITMAGCVLMAILPPFPSYPTGNLKNLINSMLSSPHAFLYANEATSATVQCPWYCNSDMATLDMDDTAGYVRSLDLTTQNGNYGTLVFMVINPLSPSTGSSTSVSIILEASFKHLDIMVPTPRIVTWTPQASFVSGLFDMAKDGLKSLAGDGIDALRGVVREWTGLHNPNTSRIAHRIIQTQRNFPNVVDNEQFFEKLDPYSDFNRILKTPIYGTDIDEMSIDHIVSKKQMIGSFTVSVNDPVGTLYWVRPISPFQGGIDTPVPPVDPNYISACNNIELMHSLHRAWRGDLNLYITSVMNNKQQVKLKVLKMYNPSVKSSSAWPVYKSIVNAPSHLLEYTQGGQEHHVSLPFLCRNDLIPCAEDMTFEPLFHGLYYIYLAQPLANSDGSPTTIEFNVFMNGAENLTFYGYANKKLLPNPLIPTRSTIFQAQSNTIKVMNSPQKQEQTSDRDDKDSSISHFDRLRPNLDMRPLFRRMYKFYNTALAFAPSDEGTINIPLASLVAEYPPANIFTPIDMISRMYYGKNVGFKIKGQFTATQLDLASLVIHCYYVPPNMTSTASNQTIVGAGVQTAAMPGLTMPFFAKQPPPIPFQVDPISVTVSTSGFEFIIPDVTLYKFMGSPDKYRGTSVVFDPLSTADFGSVLVKVENTSTLLPISGMLSMFFGLTDESRFGFHTMAPPFVINKGDSIYFGNGISPTAVVPTSLNKYLYFGGFLA